MKFLSNQRLWLIHYSFKLKYYLSFFQYLLIYFDTSDIHSWQQVFYLFQGRVHVLYFTVTICFMLTLVFTKNHTILYKIVFKLLTTG